MNQNPSPDETEEFLRSLHACPRVRDIAFHAVNEGRLLTHADRMTVLVKQGSSLIVEAVTGQKQPRNSSPELVLLRKVANVSLNSGEPVHYEGASENQQAPFSSSSALVDYISESGATSLSILPLTNGETDRPFGCLVSESFQSAPKSVNRHAGLEILAAHTSSALYKSLKYENILFRSVLLRAGLACKWLFQSKRTLITGLSLAIVCLGLLLFLFPWEYRITCNGTLIPSDRQDIFAPWDAEVKQVLVADGDDVKSGQLLLNLSSNDLDIEAVALEAVIREKKKLLSALDAQIDTAERQGSYDESIQLQGDAKKTEVEIEGNTERLELVRKRLKSLDISAPFPGKVVGFKLRQLLQDRPVQRGERLLQLMQTQGVWRLELSVPERYVGHLMQAYKDQENLKVDFVLSTAVEESYLASVESIATRVEESEQEGSFVEAIASVLPDQELEGKHIGARVIAKVNCGEKSLGYCLFGDVIDFFRRRLWF